MLVLGDESIAFNRLRAVFPMQVKPPFSTTDFVGEYASSGFPRVDASGGITSANDDVENPDQGDLEFDPIARAIYPRAQFVLHDNDFAVTGVSGDTGKTGNALIVWHDGSADPSIAYGSVLPGSGTVGTNGGGSTTTTGGAIVQGPFARTQIRAPGFTSTQIAIAQASPDVLDDPYNEKYGKSLPVYGDFRVYGDIAVVGGCQGFTGFMRLFPPADGALNPARESTSSGSFSSSSSGSSSSSSSSSSGSGSGSGSGSSTGPHGTTSTVYPPYSLTSGQHYEVVVKAPLIQNIFLSTTLPGAGPFTFGNCQREQTGLKYFYQFFPPPQSASFLSSSSLGFRQVICCADVNRGGDIFVYHNPDQFNTGYSGYGNYNFSFTMQNCSGLATSGLYTLGDNGSVTNGGGGGSSAPSQNGASGNGSGNGSSNNGGTNPFTTASGGSPNAQRVFQAAQAGGGATSVPNETGGTTQSSQSSLSPQSSAPSSVQSSVTGSDTATITGTGSVTGTGTSSGTGSATGTGTGTGSGTGTSTSGPPLLGGGLVSHTMLAFRLVGSGRTSMRWYSVLWEVGGMVTLCYNDQNDNNGNPLDAGWVVAEKLKMGEGREAVLEPDSANTYVMGPTPDDWTVGYSGENFPGKITSGLPIPGKAHTEEKLPKNHVVEVRVIGGQVRVVFGSEDTPFMWPAPETNADGVPDWYVDRFMVTGGDVYGAEWSVHPTKFAPSAALISNAINLGFVPDSGQLASLAYRCHYTPDFKSDAQVANAAQIGFHPEGYAATVETYDTFGTELRYKLAFTNPASGKTYRGLPYAHATSAVRAVGLDVPGTEWSLISPPTVLGMQGSPPKPEGIDVYHNFDLSTLSIQSSAVLTFNNFTGLWTNGEGTGIIDTKGHFGIGIELGTNIGNTLNREFTGIANTNFTNDWNGGGKDKVSVFCNDCWTFLNVPAWNLPWFDGMNVYYVIAYLAEMGSITRGQMNFADFIPDNPYGRSPGLPDSEQYFLPIGPAGTPLTRFGSGEILRNMMLKISQSIGFALFFDVYGGLNFYKFKVNPPSGYTRTFSHVPGDAQHPGQPGTDEIWAGGSYSGGLSETKNSVTVIGVNAIGPIWDPIVSHQVDMDSVYDDTVANYKGFYDAMVWADNQFVDLSYADAAGSSMLNFLRLPDRQVNFSSWYPGGNPVYPGDLIQIRYPRSGASLHTYFVLSTHASRHQGQLPRLDINARLIPI